MKQLLKHYPISLLIAIIIVYLSCFRPPKNSLEEIPNMDKIVHFAMYCGFSLLIWIEYLRSHHLNKKSISWHGWLSGFVIPTLLGCLMELIQRYFTTYRGFEWGDILSDTVGAAFASFCVALFLYFKRYK